jgi:hypothetical protein
MKVKKGTYIGEVYSRAASGRLNPDEEKITNIDPKIVVLNVTNRVIVLKMEIQDLLLYSLTKVNDRDNLSQMKRLVIDNQVYEAYKFLKVKTLKRLIAFKNNVKGQWPDLYDAGSCIYFDNALELDGISNNLMIIWTPRMDRINDRIGRNIESQDRRRRGLQFC